MANNFKGEEGAGQSTIFECESRVSVSKWEAREGWKVKNVHTAEYMQYSGGNRLRFYNRLSEIIKLLQPINH